MSPVGGVGINLAIQDAVAAANILIPKFAAGGVCESDLELVQRRREFPTRATQQMQIAIQNRVIRHVLGSSAPLELPFVLRLVRMVSTVNPNANDTPSRPIPTFGNAAASTALPHPPNTSQNVPSISAPALLVNDMEAA